MAAHANEGLSPDAAHLGWKISALKVNWVSFEDGYQNLYGTITADQDIEKVKVMFERQLVFYSEALKKGEALQVSLHLPGPAPLTPKERLDDCLMRLEHLFAAAESMLAKVFAILRNTAAPPGRAVLQAHLSALEDVKQKMDAKKLAAGAASLDTRKGPILSSTERGGTTPASGGNGVKPSPTRLLPSLS